MTESPWFAALHWDRPWLAPFAHDATFITQALTAGQPVAQVLNALRDRRAAEGAPTPDVRFVPQAELPTGQAYEDFIFHERRVPTRDNAHDLFNGLAWLAFPRTKGRLNALQGAEIGAAGVGATRGAVRDALTVFDENAAIVLAPPELLQALQARQWQRLFVGLRPQWAQAQVLLFGHAAHEKLLHPRKPITAHVYLPRGPLLWTDLDATLARDLDAEHLGQKPYTPLPILGIPGWWPENERPGFYADPQVFRPARAGT